MTLLNDLTKPDKERKLTVELDKHQLTRLIFLYQALLDQPGHRSFQLYEAFTLSNPIRIFILLRVNGSKRIYRWDESARNWLIAENHAS
jgi:hypothetical protein